ncbi:MAG: hypothetical protein EHM41_26095 [Chloroflexi bacterium]|nr:MAG: hypothetical protein EHM41_26095 [Chloroflexota bacterium]
MKPKIDKTKFGSITIAGEKYEKDALIRLNGKVDKRKKRLSKAVYGTSNTISLAEAEYVFEDGAKWILIGTGQTGMAKLSPEAVQFFQQKDCQTILLPTPEAIRCWNEKDGEGIGLFHITC